MNAIGYKYYPNIEIDTEKCDLGGACVRSCPKNILKIEGKKLLVQNIEDCTLCMSCVEVCEANCIKVRGEDSRILLSFETDGALPSKEVLTYALKNLEGTFNDLKNKIEKLK